MPEIPVIPFQPGNTFQQVDPQQGQAGLQQGDAFQQVDPSGLNPQVNPLSFLKGFGNKLKEIWNRPIIAPTITKEEHDQLIQGGGGGVHNWQNH